MFGLLCISAVWQRWGLQIKKFMPHHGLKDEAQVALELEVAEQADDVALAIWVRGTKLA